MDPRYCFDLSPNEIKIAKLTLEKLHEKSVQRSKTENVQENTIKGDSYEEYRAVKRKRLTSTPSEDTHPSDQSDIMLLFEKYEMRIQTASPEMRDRDSILAYWEDQKETDPILYRLVSMVNTIPPTQVTVERAFSILSLIYNARRTKLSLDLLQHILLINLNKDMVPGSFNAEDVAKLEAQ